MTDKLNFLYYDKSTGIVDKIDKTKFLGLHSPNTPRIDLYLFAMALGKGCGSQLSKKDSFIRGEYVPRKLEAIPLISSLVIGSDDFDKDLDKMITTNKMYEIADECANTGFRMIESMLEEESAERIELKLTADLDSLYKRNIKAK